MTSVQSAIHDLSDPTTDLETAARLLGISRTKAYELARDDAFPCKVLRIGKRQYRVVVSSLRDVLGVPA